MTAHSSTPPTRVRRAVVEDFDAIVEVWQASGLSYRPGGRDTREAFIVQLEHFPDAYLVATDGERIVGTLLGTHDQRKGWINRLAVHPDYQRQGIAVALLDACEQALHRQGIDIVVAMTEMDNDVSAEFFKASGYHEYPIRYFRKLRRGDV